ncbi:uncharacterized protein [Gossypium hirsutum]|uniref:Uncharacterized protein isoform X5 n=1 Tax=Gossypium hirsutum TaxID=3635 RepID=A0ABM3BU88_GOSHI|nr:uncharacterized protein LOC121230213 isoform X5 [Gossypium hirsutum]
MKRTFSNGSNKCFLPSAAMVWRNSSPEKSLFHQLRCVIVKVNWLKMKPMNGTFSKTVLLPHGCFYSASREPVSLEGVCSILVDAERRNLILQAVWQIWWWITPKMPTLWKGGTFC